MDSIGTAGWFRPESAGICTSTFAKHVKNDQILSSLMTIPGLYENGFGKILEIVR